MLSEQDNKKLIELINSVNIYIRLNGGSFKHEYIEKDTNSLYRFGWFYINGYKYSLCAWNFRKNIVEFENEHHHDKIKFDINIFDVLNKPFRKDSFITCKIKTIRAKASTFLGNLSDKLQP